MSGRSARHGLGDRAHSADGVTPNTPLAVHLAEGVVQQNVGGTGRVRTCIVPDDGIEAEPGLHEFAPEPGIEIIGGRFGQQLEQGAQIFRREPAKSVADPASSERFSQRCQLCSVGEVRRRLQDQLAQHIGTRVERPVEGVISFRIASTELRDTVFGATLGSEQIAAVQGGKEILRATLDNLQPMLEEAKIGDDLGVQQAYGVGRDRVSEPWAKLFRDRRAAYHRSSLEDLDFQARHAEVGGASQAIVPATNDDDVVCLHRRR